MQSWRNFRKARIQNISSQAGGSPCAYSASCVNNICCIQSCVKLSARCLMLSRFAFILFAGSLVCAQQIEGPITPKTEPAPAPQLHSASASSEGKRITVPAGTKIPLVLKQGVSTKNAKVGDHVYLQTNFPLVQDGRMVIPEGTYVQGEITNVNRAGRVKGRAEVMMHFSTLIFPSGYTVSLPGAVDSAPGARNEDVKSKEGKIEHEGEKGKDAT